MDTITRQELKDRLKVERVTLVEVLGPEYYAKFHLPGAINVPLDEDFDEAIQEALPDKGAAVVVYCMDMDCPLSGRAARRMERLGYTDVTDYEAGKMDWQEEGLPVEA